MLSKDERDRLLALGCDLASVWHAATTTPRDRKELLRALLEEVIIKVEREKAAAHLTLRWKGGGLGAINGFINFRSVQDGPELAQKFVGFDQLDADLASGNAPKYAHIVPDQCNDMHGLLAPDDCRGGEAVVGRGDAVVAQLVASIQRSPVWTSPSNAAVIITFDEGGSAPPGAPQGCCGSDRNSGPISCARRPPSSATCSYAI
jgi:Phosphoesterase family